jgi:hypothetical protein
MVARASFRCGIPDLPIGRRFDLRARDSHYALVSACEWTRTKPAVMAYRVPTILDATNIGLGFIDVMRDQIVHCDLDSKARLMAAARAPLQLCF